ncbi:DUF1428 domain-containing protein [Aureimonas sp. AU22]|jgi:uncharacterized protein YbaA (DUF1428 family)|uniref:DUF1428 domain-containing protein n=1 Tax=Aureimonas sp. AU22 TaxID=1638162 RepID=UPI0007811F44|nr:DUF1428 domain-containing protein [Aureimonas sp. AU22]
MAYVEGFLVPVPEANRQAYLELAARAAPLFREYGALEVVECWGADIPDGKVTDFRRAVKAEAGETVVFSWIIYPSKSVRDEAVEKVFKDPRMDMDEATMPFSGQRMVFGGFDMILKDAG